MVMGCLLCAWIGGVYKTFDGNKAIRRVNTIEGASLYCPCSLLLIVISYSVNVSTNPSGVKRRNLSHRPLRSAKPRAEVCQDRRCASLNAQIPRIDAAYLRTLKRLGCSNSAQDSATI